MDVAEKTTGPKLRVAVAADAMSATLVIPGGMDSDAVTEDACVQCLKQAQVVVNDDVRLQLCAGLNACAKQPDAEATIVLKGRAPEHGEDGRVEWETDCDLEHLIATSTQQKNVDFYNRRSYIAVKEHQRIAKIVPPTPGTDGINVMGNRIKAEPGCSVALKPDDSILLDASGTLTALKHGVLTIDGKTLRISPSLRVDEYVDFHTGNIKFDGDVEIRRGIRDKFSVEATGSVTVHGLIEAATLKVGGDMHALGGMAAKCKNLVLVKGDLHARYLDNVIGTVKGNLVVEREVLNCTLNVTGDTVVRGGGLMGGKTCAAGTVNVMTLGAPSGDRTIISLASIREIDELLEQTESACALLQRQLDKVDEELAQLQRNNARSASQRESMTELMFKQTELKQRMDRIGGKRDELRDYVDRTCKVDLHINRGIEPGTMIICRGIKASFDSVVKGPLWIGWDRRRRNLVWRIGEEGVLQPITEIASVSTAG